MIDHSLAEGNSYLHQIDPRIRILIAVLFSCLMSVAQQLSTLALSLGFALLITLPLASHFFQILKKIFRFNAFILLFWIFLPLTMSSEPILLFERVVLSKDGIWLALILTFKMNTLFLIMITMITTIPISHLGASLQRLYVCKKFIVLLLFTYRYIFILAQEFQTLRIAARLRGFQPSTNLYTYRTYANMVGTLLIRSIKKAEQVQQAMLCRGFFGTFHSLEMDELDAKDWICFVFALHLLALLGVTEWIR